jgi:AraC-like DNA-binding protein
LFRRYRRYLDDNFSDTARLRFRGLRDLLVAALLGLVLWVGFEVLNEAIGPLGYGDYWYAYFANGALIYYLGLVGLQANFAAVVPLRFEPEAPSTTSDVPYVAGSAMPMPMEGGTAAASLPTTSYRQPAANADKETEGQFIDGSELLVAQTSVIPQPVAALTAGLAPELHPWREKLQQLMADEQPWLEPELTLAELAHRLRTNTSLLSHVINTGCGQNFNDFVNSYRVAEAERKLQDPRLAHYSLVGIALESGFNSKSTFNRVFKKLTGRTPSEVIRPKS